VASEYKDDWRYIGCDTWRLDKLAGKYSPEDDWIEEIDNTNNPQSRRQLCLTDWLQSQLTDRQYKIINDYAWEGRSMAVIGSELGITRVRVWQIYKEILNIMKIRCDGDHEKYKELFIGQ